MFVSAAKGIQIVRIKICVCTILDVGRETVNLVQHEHAEPVEL